MILPFQINAGEVLSQSDGYQIAKIEDADIKTKSLNLFMLAKKAIKEEKYNESIELLNEFLLLPLNENSEDAQQLIGWARDKVGDLNKAKAEYELYLKIYPTGKYVQVVKARLSGIDNREKQEKQLPTLAEPRKKKVKEVDSQTITGSISQYYYGGRSQETVTNGAADGQVTKTNMQTQSSLINNISLTGRIRHNEYDTKIVIRDTQISNFMNNVPSYNTVSTGYVEHSNKAYDYMFRVGRQSNVAQGVLGRFDGIFARVGINSQWRVTGVYGEPTTSGRTQAKTDRYFYGAAVEFGPFDQKWSGSVYGIQQVADGLVERRAIGSDLRYFNGDTTFFGTIDYDTIYNEINIAMLQSFWKIDDYTFNVVLDHRKSPVLYAETAIQVGSPVGAQSVSDLRRLFSNDQIYGYVNGLVPVTDLGMIGVSKPLNSKWQVAGDVRVTRTSSTNSLVALDYQGNLVNTIDVQPGTGNQYALTLQAVAKGLIFKDDTSVIMGNYINDPQYNAYMMSLTNSNTLQEKWRLDSLVHFYTEDRTTNSRTWRLSPGLRANYYWRDNMSFEADLRVDYTHTTDPVSALTTSRWDESLFLGYRWDIR